MVERFLRYITTERLRRGVFTSVAELIDAIDGTSLATSSIQSRSSGPKARAMSCGKSFGPTAA